jgi:hypothetical protein
MKSLFSKLIWGALFAVSTVTVWGQDAETIAMLMQSINTHLTNGNCEKAQSAYDSWKSYTNSINSSVESRIKLCQGTKEQLQKLAVGQEVCICYDNNSMIINCTDNCTRKKEKGRITYLDATGQHGLLLVKEVQYTCYNCPPFYSNGTDYYIPSKAELELIYPNRYLLGLNDEYWSSTEANNALRYRHYIMDFSNGKSSAKENNKKYHKLWIYKF